jgi:hypothetical protein
VILAGQRVVSEGVDVVVDARPLSPMSSAAASRSASADRSERSTCRFTGVTVVRDQLLQLYARGHALRALLALADRDAATSSAAKLLRSELEFDVDAHRRRHQRDPAQHHRRAHLGLPR